MISLRRQHNLAGAKKAALWLALLAALLAQLAEAQFFTKSSKSIPRMGRRSVDGGQKSSIDVYRRLLIDSLVDEYGPNLFEALQKAQIGEENLVSQGQVAGSSGSKDRAPVDFASNELGEELTRKREDSSGPLANLVASRAREPRDSTLAMRAFNTNRLIQHLASGQPLMSYDRLFGNSNPNGHSQQQQKQQQQQVERSSRAYDNYDKK